MNQNIPFNLAEARNNKPFEVYHEPIGWMTGHLEHVSIIGGSVIVTVNGDDIFLPSEQLRMKSL